MPFSENALGEFRAIYKKETGIEISNEEADKIARELYHLFEVLSNPSEYRRPGSPDIQ